MSAASARKAAAAPLAAYVLHSWDWSETSLIVELFTRERGRIVVAAKGAKRPYSQLRPVLIPFQRLLVQLGRTPADESAEVHLLRSSERAGGPPSRWSYLIQRKGPRPNSSRLSRRRPPGGDQ